jgi:hypothetical protein
MWSCHVVEVDLDDVPSTLGVDFVVHHLLVASESISCDFLFKQSSNFHTFR